MLCSHPSLGWLSPSLRSVIEAEQSNAYTVYATVHTQILNVSHWHTHRCNCIPFLLWQVKIYTMRKFYSNHFLGNTVCSWRHLLTISSSSSPNSKHSSSNSSSAKKKKQQTLLKATLYNIKYQLLFCHWCFCFWPILFRFRWHEPREMMQSRRHLNQRCQYTLLSHASFQT